MNEQFRVPIALLRQATEIALGHLESIEGVDVALDKDLFWSIDPEQLYNVYDQPSGFTVGQLTECAEQLEELVADPSRVTSFSLVWISDLLRAAGQTVVR